MATASEIFAATAAQVIQPQPPVQAPPAAPPMQVQQPTMGVGPPPAAPPVQAPPPAAQVIQMPQPGQPVQMPPQQALPQQMPPVQAPPVQMPPVQMPPQQMPPQQMPPVQAPPVQAPPAAPPVQAQPVTPQHAQTVINQNMDEAKAWEHIVNQYDNEGDRELALAHARDLAGVDPETGLPTQDGQPHVPPDPQQQQAAQQAAAAAAQQAAQQAAQVAPAQQADTLAQQQLEAMRDQLSRQQAQIVQFEGERALNQREDELREQAVANTAALAASLATENQHAIAKLEAFKEEHGPEAALELQRITDEAGMLRNQQLVMAQEAEFNRLRNEAQQSIASEVPAEMEVRRYPELVQWRADAWANSQGDASKDPHAYRLAVAHAERLTADPTWAARTVGERLGEVVRLVKETLPGVAPPVVTPVAGFPPVQAAPPAAPAQPAIPLSLSQIGGGSAPTEANPLAVLDTMNIAQIHDVLGRMDPNAVSSLMSDVVNRPPEVA